MLPDLSMFTLINVAVYNTWVFVCVSDCVEHMSLIICALLTGFGFLTFELEDSVNLVVNEHFIQISGKQVLLWDYRCGELRSTLQFNEKQ